MKYDIDKILEEIATLPKKEKLDGADAQTKKIIEKNLSDATKKYILQRKN